jgi:hypothetical protein
MATAKTTSKTSKTSVAGVYVPRLKQLYNDDIRTQLKNELNLEIFLRCHCWKKSS